MFLGFIVSAGGVDWIEQSGVRAAEAAIVRGRDRSDGGGAGDGGVVAKAGTKSFDASARLKLVGLKAGAYGKNLCHGLTGV